jgi:hypothetical protein
VDDRIWRNVSIVLGVICALLIGVAGALMIVGPRGAPSAAASESPAVESPTPAVETTGPSSPGPSTTAQGESPSPSAGPAQSATITFNGLTLDSEKDKTATARTFTFTSYGSDPLTIAVTKNSPGGSTRMCVSVDGGTARCTVGGLPSNTKARGDAGAQNNWKVTLAGYGTSKPTIDVTFTWPTANPMIKLTHGRLQGVGPKVIEGLNGFTATFKPRGAGSLNVQASWTGVTADVDLSLADVTTPPSVKLDDRQYKAATYVNPPYAYNVDSTKTYLLKLRDLSPDSARPDLTAQISFP